jgi:cell division protein FtsB
MQLIQTIIDKAYDYRRKIATGGIGLFAVLLGFHVVFGANGMLQYGNKRSEYQKIQLEVQQMEAQNAKLQQEIKALKTDPNAIVWEARTQLKYTRPGEVIYVMPTPKPEMNSARASKK